jgi:murein DD-endopeptidase MepM/ murein hydrolase activator NlpD
VIALCSAGVVAGALGGNLVGAGAQNGSVATVPDTALLVAAEAPDTTDTTTTTTSPVDTTPRDPPSQTTTTTTPGATPPPPAATTTTTTKPASPAAPAASSKLPKPFTYPPIPLGDLAPAPDPAAKACEPNYVPRAKKKPAKKLRAGAKSSLSAPEKQAAVECVPQQSASAHTTGTNAAEELRGKVKQDNEAKATALRNAQGVPTLADPTTSLALPGAAAIGVPNFFIDKFRIPIFLLPIYQAAGVQYGVRWEVLAAINEIETDYGRNLNVSSAGALGWMQFMPATWDIYGVDANGDGRNDPFNPVDAIFAAARYLRAAGAETDLRRAIFAYNHADWYVESVLMRARVIGGLPTDLVSSLSGLTQGRFPVYAKARYADDLSERNATRRVATGKNAAMPVESDRTRRGIDIFAAPGSPVIAVQDGTITKVAENKRLGRYITLADAYGNTYTYSHLKSVAARVPVPKPRTQSQASIARELALPSDPTPTRAATAGRPTNHPALGAAAAGSGAAQGATGASGAGPAATPARPSGATGASGPSGSSGATAAAGASGAAGATGAADASGAAGATGLAGPTGATGTTGLAGPADPALEEALAASAPVVKERLFAHPGRRNALRHGGRRQLLEQQSTFPPGETLKSYFTGSFGLDEQEVVLKPLIAGRRVVAGTILGRIGKVSKKASPHVHFEIRPSGRGAPKIDPKPILDGWKLLEATAIYRARGSNPLVGAAAADTSIGEILLMSKDALAQHVLSNPRIEIYSCGRRDIEAGGIDRRVLATLEFLAASGLKPSVTSLHCGHSFYTASGNVSEHSAGSAVDIAKVNGIPILGHQGEGSIADITIRRLLTLQGTMKPHQIISLMTYPGTDNTLALGDHADHIHVGFSPEYAAGSPAAKELASVLKPSQWVKLIDRLGQIDNPAVARKPSKYAVPVPVDRSSTAHSGE